nr:hypothetical protein [Gemmatimonadota bacterium]
MDDRSETPSSDSTADSSPPTPPARRRSLLGPFFASRPPQSEPAQSESRASSASRPFAPPSASPAPLPSGEFRPSSRTPADARPIEQSPPVTGPSPALAEALRDRELHREAAVSEWGDEPAVARPART